MHGTRHEVTTDFRLRWLGHAAVAVALASALLIGVLRVLLDVPLGASYAGAWHDIAGLQHALVPLLGFATLLWLLLAGAATGLIAHLVAHRIAAPLFRLEHLADGLRRGDLGPSPALRHGDQLQGLSEALGDLESALVAQVRAAGGPAAEIEHCAARLDASSGAGQAEALDCLDALCGELERLLPGPPAEG